MLSPLLLCKNVYTGRAQLRSKLKESNQTQKEKVLVRVGSGVGAFSSISVRRSHARSLVPNFDKFISGNQRN